MRVGASCSSGAEAVMAWTWADSASRIGIPEMRGHLLETPDQCKEQGPEHSGPGPCCRSKEHCLMGIKGTVRRSYGRRLYTHANVDIDLIIDEEPRWQLWTSLARCHIAEHFSARPDGSRVWARQLPEAGLADHRTTRPKQQQLRLRRPHRAT